MTPGVEPFSDILEAVVVRGIFEVRDVFKTFGFLAVFEALPSLDASSLEEPTGAGPCFPGCAPGCLSRLKGRFWDGWPGRAPGWMRGRLEGSGLFFGSVNCFRISYLGICGRLGYHQRSLGISFPING